MRWGLVPAWWKKPLKELPAIFNAQVEKVETGAGSAPSCLCGARSATFGPANALIFRRFLWNNPTATRFLSLKREACVVLNKKPDKWRNAVEREAERQFAIALERIGERLRFKHAKIVVGPLPARMTVLLDELRRLRCRNGLSAKRRRADSRSIF